MGTTRRFKYRIECRTNDNACVNSNIRGVHVYGIDKKPVDLQKWCEELEKSEDDGGTNRHVSLSRGWLLAIHSAKVICQSDETIVEEYKAAPFRAF